MSLRTDERSWLIYDEEVIGAAVRMMEAYALGVTGQKLARSEDVRIRAVGNMMNRLGQTRGAECIRNGGVQGEAAVAFVMLGSHLAGMPHDEVKCAVALDELHAIVFRLDQKAKSTGTKGPGAVRQALRGD